MIRALFRNPACLAKTLLALGVALFLVSVLMWMAGGARSGLYKTSIAVTLVDPITEIEYPDIRPGFVPGMETLAFGFAAFSALFFASALVERRGEPKEPTKPN